MPKVVMIGCGGMGRHHAAVLKKLNVALAAGAETSLETREKFKAECGVPTVYGDYREMLEKEKPDCAFICLPTGLHDESAIACAEAGVHVMMEKPMCMTVEGGKKMIQAFKKNKRQLMIAFCRRFDNFWGKLKELVLGGAIGRPVYWRQVFSGAGPGRWFMDKDMGGGPFMDGCVHNYDFCLWTFGNYKRVISSIEKYKPSTALDTGVTNITFESGDHTTLNWSWGLPPDCSGLNAQDIIGPKGVIHFQVPNDKLPAGFDPQRQGAFYVVRGKTDIEVAVYEKNDMYIEEDKHFLECAAANRKPSVDGVEGLKATKLACEVMKKAAR